MNKQILVVIQVLAVAALLAVTMQTLSADATSLKDFFESRRVTKCPVPGQEQEYNIGKVTITVLNLPKESCRKQCKSSGLESIVGSEQVSFGPKLVCCCKPKEEAKSNESADFSAADSSDF